MRSTATGDQGVAMIFVIAIGLVVTILVVAMFGNVLQNSTSFIFFAVSHLPQSSTGRRFCGRNAA